MEREKNNSNAPSMGFTGVITRFITSAIILAVTAFFTPGFEIASFWTLIVASVVLTLIDYLVNTIVGNNVGVFGNGITSFIVSAIVLYVTQFFVAGYTISWMAAIIGALIYGVIDYFIPGNQSM